MILAVPFVLFAAAADPTTDTTPAPTSAPTPATTRALRVAVLDLTAAGVDPRVKSVVTESLLTELRKLSHVSVLSMGEVRSMLDFEAQKQLLGCDETSCVQEIADALGADVLVSGGMAKVGDESVLTLKRVEPAKASVAKSFEKRLTPAGGEEYLAALGGAVNELFPELPLRPGAVRGVAPEVALLLNPPPLPRAAFIAAGAVTAASVVGAGAAGVVWAFEQAGYHAYANEGLKRVIDGASLEGQRAATTDAEIATWSLLGIAAAGAVVSGVMIPFVDWRGASDAVVTP